MLRREVFYIDGDGIGPEVMSAARPVIDRAVELAYAGDRGFAWRELLAGEKAYEETGSHLPVDTLEALKKADLAIKGPLATPVGGGLRSLNVTLRQVLDLYACIRPIRYFQGLQTPVKHPERVDMIIFRENTEDVYAGIEYAAGTAENKKLEAFLREELHAPLPEGAGLCIKPISREGSRRLIRMAIQYALDHGRRSVTLMHKGNIMKYTEGAFRAWGYELAKEEFAGKVVTEAEAGDIPGRLVIKDRIADALFQMVLLRPLEYDIIATTNLNGDYLSDALAAQVGGLGLAPGVNMSDTLAVFEATHGTAPIHAGKDKANPGSLILSGAMMLDHLGWTEAARNLEKAIASAISGGRVTYDLARQMDSASIVGCREFGEIIIEQLEKQRS